MHRHKDTDVCCVRCGHICTKRWHADGLHSVYQQLQRGAVHYRQLHGDDNTHMCDMRHWDICAIGWHTNCLRKLHGKLQCWQLYEWQLYHNS